MRKETHNYIEQNKLLTPFGHVLTAVSGGADSVVLLHLLQSLGYTCTAAHCNFHLRGKESDRDEQFVTKLCQQWNIPLVKTDFDTENYAHAHKLSIEMAARELRYTWFEQMRQQCKAEAIAVAHHADDQAETMLMNLVRGTGLRGLCGMQPRNGFVVRPLLSASRADIEHYATENGLDYVIDSTNAQTQYKRNRFRHQVLPLLAEINPNIRQTLGESQRYFFGYWQLAQQAIKQITKQITDTKDGVFRISLSGLSKLSAPETVLHELLSPYGFTPDVTAQLWRATEGIAGKQFANADHVAIKDRTHILVFGKTAPTEAQPNLQKHIRNRQTTEVFPPAKGLRALFDAQKLDKPLSLRHWQQGDTFVPFGMDCRKKLSDFFTDQKLNLHEKQNLWLLLCGDEIAWVIGYRTSQLFRIDEQTSQVVEITASSN